MLQRQGDPRVELEEARKELANTRDDLTVVRENYRSIVNSTCWRSTALLRYAAGRIPWIRRLLRRANSIVGKRALESGCRESSARQQRPKVRTMQLRRDSTVRTTLFVRTGNYQVCAAHRRPAIYALSPPRS